MKKVSYFSFLLLCSMMVFNNVNAQSTDDLRKQRERNRVERSLKQECEDDDQYMAEIGKATSATANSAETQALLNCQQKLKLRLEQTVKGIVEDLSHSEELESTEAFDAITLRKINTGFQGIINKSIGHLIKCYSDSWKNDKGQWEAEYNGKIAIDEFLKEAKSAISEDATLRANIGFDAFEKEFRESLKSETIPD